MDVCGWIVVDAVVVATVVWWWGAWRLFFDWVTYLFTRAFTLSKWVDTEVILNQIAKTFRGYLASLKFKDLGKGTCPSMADLIRKYHLVRQFLQMGPRQKTVTELEYWWILVIGGLFCRTYGLNRPRHYCITVCSLSHFGWVHSSQINSHSIEISV